MNNFERLAQNKNDHILLDFIQSRAAQSLVANATFNRGDFFEMAITLEPVKRTGLHVVSEGDFIYHGQPVEIKYLTKKSGASKDRKGTIANYYLIGFNTGKEIELRLIAKKDLVIKKEKTREKIRYQDNITLGVKLATI